MHRDVKPANVFLVRRAGSSGSSTAKLLDFGLAKAAAPQVAANVSFAPTTPAALTAQGVIVGAAILLRSQPPAPPTARLSISLAPADDLWNYVAVSRDGTRIAFEAVGGGKIQLYVRRIGDVAAAAIYTGEVNSPPFSPDGRWIAYQSDESGRDEVFVQRFPALDSKAQVSTEGGSQPVWSRDGRALFYRGVRTLMVVPVSAGDVVQLGAPKVLGEDVYTNKGGPHTGYDATNDGRLIFARDSQQQAATKYLAVVENWLPELLRRVPIK